MAARTAIPSEQLGKPCNGDTFIEEAEDVEKKVIGQGGRGREALGEHILCGDSADADNALASRGMFYLPTS